MTSIFYLSDWFIQQIWLLLNNYWSINCACAQFSIDIDQIMSSTYMVFRCVFTIINMCFFVRSKTYFCSGKWNVFFLCSGAGFCNCRLQLVAAYKVVGLSSTHGQSVVHCACGSDNIRLDFRLKLSLSFFVHLDPLATISMLLGAVGCIGAWFEKKAWLFIVIRHSSICFLLLFSFVWSTSLRWSSSLSFYSSALLLLLLLMRK